MGRIEITAEDLKKGFEANYGPRVRCRAIVLDNQRRAQEVWDMARRTPTVENFSELAGKYSIKRSSRALLGEVPPIKKYGGQPVLEDEAFSLKPGEISGIIQLDDKFVILFCEGYTKPIDVKQSEVERNIAEDIREKKEKLAMREYYQRLQDKTMIDNFLDPTASHSPAKPIADRQPAGATVPAAYEMPVQR